MIVEKISTYLKTNGITQSFLAEKIGMKKNTLSMTLNGKRELKAEEFLQILLVLNIDPNLFLNNKN